MKYGLPENLLAELNQVFTKNTHIEKVILFGSRAMGNYKEGSDIDLAIVAKGFSLNEKLDINIQLEELGYPYKFDILVYHQIKNRELLMHIDRVGISIYLNSR